MKRFFRTRAARKFFRQPLAVAALGITLVYLLTALFVGLGMISRSEADLPVGPSFIPGFLEAPTVETRLEHCEYLLDRVELALMSANVQDALANSGFLQMPVANLPPTELRALVDRGWKIYEPLALDPDVESKPAQMAELAQVEAITSQLYPAPEGWSGFLHDLYVILGTDRQGRSIFLRAVYSIKVAILVGIVSAVAAVLIGSLLGAAAAFFGGWVDHVVTWLYTAVSSIPYLVLLIVLVYAFMKTPFHGTLVPLYVAMVSTFWIGPCRVIRGETLKIKELEYVQAATAIGFGRFYVMLRHIMPNVAHLMLINFSLLFIAAIKSEVILSFLGLGVKDEPSWGIMISQSSAEVILGFFWQIGAATAFMFVLVLAFNILSDAVQDAYDPKHN